MRSTGVLQVDPSTNSVVTQFKAVFYDIEGSIGVGEGGVWLVTIGEGFKTVLTQFNSKTGVAEANIPWKEGSIAASGLWFCLGDK
jgi:virginiamycin B lyase